MKQIKKVALSLSMAFGFITAMAAPVDEAKKLYFEGEYQQALEILEKLAKRTPRDGTVTYYLGASLHKLGRTDEAIQPLKVSEGRNVAVASELLTQIALDQYRVADAEAHMEKWESSAKKQRKELGESFNETSGRLVRMKNMMERVEKIEILDSIEIDSATFFTAYRLSAPAGRILPPEAINRLQGIDGLNEVSAGYMPENNSEVLWAAKDDEFWKIYSAGILDDGSMDHTTALPDNLAEGGNAMYPFLMPDGMTLYFANDGQNSLGGYDIFMTRRTEGDNGQTEYFQPQNMGMPYNSPYNDFLLAIDEASGLGWWATDRNQVPGKVTIYVFAPSQVRVNVEPDDSNIASLARLDNISLTRNPDTDYKAMLAKKLPKESNQATSQTSPRFCIDLGGGRVYTHLSDFRSQQAKSAMLELLGRQARLRKHIEAEEKLRQQYRNGNKSVSQAILDSEEETTRMRAEIKQLRNSVARLEK